MNSTIKCTRELIAVPRVRIEIGMPADMPCDEIADLSVEICREIRDALKEMIDTRTETYTAETHDGDAPEWDEDDLENCTPAYEPMTLPDDVREMLTAQMGRLDKLAATLVLDDDAMPLGGMASITQSMCEIAKELRG